MIYYLSVFLSGYLFGVIFLLVCRVLEHLLLRDTYTQESLPALQKIRSVIIAFRLFRSPLCVLLAHRNFKSSVHSLHEFHFVPILLLVVVQMLCVWMLHAIQVGGHFNWAAWNCDLHRGYVMEANEEATAAYNRAVISTQNLLFITRVLRSSTSFCNVIFWFTQGIFSYMLHNQKDKLSYWLESWCWIFGLAMCRLINPWYGDYNIGWFEAVQ